MTWTDRFLLQIRPGHYITCQSFGKVDERPYWDMSFPNKVSHDIAEEL